MTYQRMEIPLALEDRRVDPVLDMPEVGVIIDGVRHVSMRLFAGSGDPRARRRVAAWHEPVRLGGPAVDLRTPDR